MNYNFGANKTHTIYTKTPIRFSTSKSTQQTDRQTDGQTDIHACILRCSDRPKFNPKHFPMALTDDGEREIFYLALRLLVCDGFVHVCVCVCVCEIQRYEQRTIGERFTFHCPLNFCFISLSLTFSLSLFLSHSLFFSLSHTLSNFFLSFSL